MVSTLAPSARQNAASRSTARVGAFGRREDAPAADEQFGKAGVRAGMLGAGDRMGGDEMHARRQMRGHVAHDRALDRADIGNDGARLEMRRDLLGDLAAGADRNADDDEIGAGDRRGVGLDHLVGEPKLGDAPPRRGRARLATISRTAPCARAARAIEEPMRPTPISARRLNNGAEFASQHHAALPEIP